MQPGQLYNPGESPEPHPQPEQDHQLPAPQERAAPAPEHAPQVAPGQAEPAWQFNEEADANTDENPVLQPAPTVTWTASEYIAHDKNAGWYLLAILAAIVLAGFVYLITRDAVSPAVVVVLGVAFAVFGARKPQVLEYSISSAGVQIGQKLYPFGLFRTFSIIEEDAVRSILLMPLQRFNLPISIYFDPSDEQKIIEALSAHLPHEERRMSPVDNLMRKIRF